jgi:hypothetical protein
MTALMPEEKTWEKEGVSIIFLPYENTLSVIVQAAMRQAYLYDAPTDADPDRKEIPTMVYMFYKAMPLILSVSLSEDAPRWGRFLKDMVESPTWLQNPVSDYKQIEKRADANLLFDCYAGFNETREKVFAAPPELQSPEPQKPLPDPETGVVDPDALNFTDSSTPHGEPSSNVKVLKGRGKSSAVPHQRAK